MAPVFINQQNGTQIHTQAISLDLLKAGGTLVTDTNGNHYLIALTSSAAESQNRRPSQQTKSNGRVTLQVQVGTKRTCERSARPSLGFFPTETAVDSEQAAQHLQAITRTERQPGRERAHQKGTTTISDYDDDQPGTFFSICLAYN